MNLGKHFAKISLSLPSSSSPTCPPSPTPSPTPFFSLPKHQSKLSLQPSVRRVIIFFQLILKLKVELYGVPALWGEGLLLDHPLCLCSSCPNENLKITSQVPTLANALRPMGLKHTLSLIAPNVLLTLWPQTVSLSCSSSILLGRCNFFIWIRTLIILHGKLRLIPSPPYYQECFSPCVAQSGLLSAFRHHLSPLGLFPCGFYRHKLKPKAVYEIRSKDSLVPLERTDGIGFSHQPTMEGTKLAKITLEIEGVSSTVTNILLPSLTYMVCLIGK